MVSQRTSSRAERDNEGHDDEAQQRSSDTGERIGVTRDSALALRPDAHDSQTLVLLLDFPPEEEDNTSYAPPAFKIELLEPDETMSRRFSVVGTATKDPLLDLAHMRVCVAFYRGSSNPSADEPLLPGWISQSLAHAWREVACSPVTAMPVALSG